MHVSTQVMINRYSPSGARAALDGVFLQNARHATHDVHPDAALLVASTFTGARRILGVAS